MRTTRAQIPAGIHSRLFFRPASRKKEASNANAHLIRDNFIVFVFSGYVCFHVLAAGFLYSQISLS